jgi:hypothetical protein
MMLKPVDVAYMNAPKIFYNDLKDQYLKSLDAKEHHLINEYIKTSYLQELEKAIHTNSELFEQKSGYYYKAFTKGLIALPFYLLCSSFVIIY